MNTMFLTVTANSALDQVCFIKRFSPGTRMVASKFIESVGGKGFDTSVALRAINLQTVALGFVAGANGNRLMRLIESYGIIHDLIWVEGETRVALLIVEEDYNRHSHIMIGGYSIRMEAQEELTRRFKNHLLQAKWVILAGSLPEGISPDFYGRLNQIAKHSQVPVLVDCSGEAALQCIITPPTVLKMNWPEFNQTFHMDCQNISSLMKAGQEIRLTFRLPSLVITCGEDGILAITDQGSYFAVAPRQEPINAAGAGDATSAALTWRLSQGDSWREALRWAAAAGAATVLTERTAECYYSDIEKIHHLTKIHEI
ncbi:hexose kinase [Bellilinea sp.]|uniref:1-phosphofructokinase family hexose kinase n=1 Tax=Bellilinea sp. TaxID=2838785 RepID=UPI002ADD951B|nr:hexose kinase [Bellilinea sp.]